MGIGAEINRRLVTDRLDRIEKMMADMSDADLEDLKADAIANDPNLNDVGRAVMLSKSPRTNGILRRMIYERLTKHAPAVSAPRVSATQFLHDELPELT